VLNDQGDDLVDTELLRANGIAADQVGRRLLLLSIPRTDRCAGSPRHEWSRGDLRGGRRELHRYRRDHPAPAAARSRPPVSRRASHRCWSTSSPTIRSLRFLFDQQVAEADVVIDRRVDVPAWIEDLLREGIAVGTKSISVDYARYAEAEAALGLAERAGYATTAAGGIARDDRWPAAGTDRRSTSAAGIRIVHLKVLAQCESGYVKAALTANGREARRSRACWMLRPRPNMRCW